jgi:hypothetical protein
VLYGYTFVVPALLWLLFKYAFSVSFNLLELVCVYGYSLTPFIPMAVIYFAFFKSRVALTE